MIDKNMNPDNPATRADVRYMPDEYFELKARIHDRLLDLIDLSLIDRLDRENLSAQIRKVVEKILREESFDLPLNMVEREKILPKSWMKYWVTDPLNPC